MRKELYKLLTEQYKTPGKWDHITSQIGMFSFTGYVIVDISMMMLINTIFATG